MKPFGQALVVAIVALGFAAAPITAQEPQARLALRGLRDSLALASDSLPLHQLELLTIDVARVQRDDPLIHIRLGLIALRLGEVSGTVSHFDDAAGEFEWALSLRPDWPFAWYGLGLAEAQLPDRARTAFGALQVMLGNDRDRLAGNAFARAIQLDPSFTEAVADFAAIVLDQRIGAPVGPAIAALRNATASRLGWDPRLLLLLGRLERLAGNVDSARLDFSRAQQLSIRPSVPLLELARTLALTGDTISASPGEPNPVELAYYTASESNDPELVEMLRGDLLPIVGDTLIAQFDSLKGVARTGWLRHFWSKRDGADLRTPGSRLVEHYRRWFHAIRDFRLPPYRRRYRLGIELFQSHDVEFDDRGIIWLRHGEPTKRIVWPQAFRNRATDDAPDYGDETWRYVRPEGDFTLHFAARDDQGDYRLVESIFNLGMTADGMVIFSRDLPGLNRMLHAGPNTFLYLQNEERLRSRKDIFSATTSDSWMRSYERMLPVRAELSAVGVSGGGTLVHVVYSVDAAAVRRAAAAVGNSGTVPVTLRAAFLDRSGSPVARLDTVQRVRVPEVGAGKMVTIRAEVPVPSGVQKVRLGAELSTRNGALFPIDSVRVPQVSGPRLDLSSLVVGTASHGLGWQPVAGDTVWFDGTGVYSPADTIVVYAEAYGIRNGVDYATRLSITHQQGAIARFLSGRQQSITFKDDSRFVGTVGRYRRVVDLHGLTPGNYTVELTVDGPTGKEVRKLGITIR